MVQEARTIFFYDFQYSFQQQKKLEIHWFSQLRDQFTYFLTSEQIWGTFPSAERGYRRAYTPKFTQKIELRVLRLIRCFKKCSNRTTVPFSDDTNNQKLAQFLLSSEIEHFQFFVTKAQFLCYEGRRKSRRADYGICIKQFCPNLG